MNGENGGPDLPVTVEQVFKDFEGRRAGIIKALTTDFEEFYQRCDPDKENFCLFAYPSGQWEVSLPSEEVPPELPEPSIGINFARDGMRRKEWLILVAAHSEGWLLSVAFYFAARFGFDKAERKMLFDMMNDLPSVFETVAGALKKQQQNEKSSVSNHSGSKAKSNSKSRQGESQGRSRNQNLDSIDETEVLYEEEEEEENGDTLCGACGKNDGMDDVWICCDKCQGWFHCRCVKISPAKAKYLKQYKCPFCCNKRARPF